MPGPDKWVEYGQAGGECDKLKEMLLEQRKSRHIHYFIDRRVGNPACTICGAEVRPEYALAYMDGAGDAEVVLTQPEVPPQ